MKLEYDITSSTFKYVESLWFNYHNMINKMHDIERDVINEPDINSDIKAKGITSDPTAQAIFRRDYARRNGQYRTLERQVQAIADVYNELPDDYKKVANERYFCDKKRNWNEIAKKIRYSERHARRIRDMIVVATAEKLHLW